MNKGGPNSLPMAPKTTGIHSLAAPTVSQELLKYRRILPPIPILQLIDKTTVFTLSNAALKSN